MIEDSQKVQEATKLQRFIYDAVNNKLHHIFKNAHEKAINGTYTEMYQMLE